jgi:hypothetical protein
MSLPVKDKYDYGPKSFGMTVRSKYLEWWSFFCGRRRQDDTRAWDAWECADKPDEPSDVEDGDGHWAQHFFGQVPFPVPAFQQLRS